MMARDWQRLCEGSASGFSSPTSGPHGLLYDLSADLLFLSLGLWASRAFFLIQRHRAFTAGSPTSQTPV